MALRQTSRIDPIYLQTTQDRRPRFAYDGQMDPDQQLDYARYRLTRESYLRIYPISPILCSALLNCQFNSAILNMDSGRNTLLKRN
jgi:hypothetical protein